MKKSFILFNLLLLFIFYLINYLYILVYSSQQYKICQNTMNNVIIYECIIDSENNDSSFLYPKLKWDIQQKVSLYKFYLEKADFNDDPTLFKKIQKTYFIQCGMEPNSIYCKKDSSKMFFKKELK